MSRERYPVDFPKLPSVTTILGAFPSPALVAWYKCMAFQEQKEITDKGKEIGSTLHELRIRIEKGEPFEITTAYPEEVQNCLKAYFQWKKERGIQQIICSELKMWSTDLGYMGIFDDLVKRGNDLILLEFKTNNGIYDEHMEQAVAYKKLYESWSVFTNGIKKSQAIKEVWIVRFPKVKPENPDAPLYEIRQVLNSEMDELFESFNHKLAIYNIRKRREKHGKSNG